MIMNSTKICSKCGIEKPLDEFHNQKNGKDDKRADCKKCNKEKSAKYYQENREEIKQTHKKYQEEHEDELREKAGNVSMYENKTCSNYLGIVVAERLCRHLFKDVEVMPHGNTGFDIICNKGKKIDVKSGCVILSNGRPRWKFHIDHNSIADFFILVAFDNRTDLNPLHMWMIPGNELNHQGSASTTLSRIHKWNKWKRDINDAQLCCTEMKKEK